LTVGAALPEAERAVPPYGVMSRTKAKSNKITRFIGSVYGIDLLRRIGVEGF
jgi:hypothetical protein